MSELEKNHLSRVLVFEKMSRIAEELDFATEGSARWQHLRDHVSLLSTHFDTMHREGAELIMKSRRMLALPQSSRLAQDEAQARTTLQAAIENIETTHIRYHQLVTEILKLITRGQYGLSIQKLNRVQSRERHLSSEMERFVGIVSGTVHKSLQRSSREAEKISLFLAVSLIVILLSSSGVVFFTRNIVRSLRNLAQAAHSLGEGNYGVALDAGSDEVGEVNAAFALMSKKLEVARRDLETKNLELLDHVDLISRQKDELEKVNKELDSFAHTVSHDIRSPLMGIMGYGSVLSKHCCHGLDERGQRAVAGIQKGSQRLNEMIDDLLTMTRLARVQNP
jgi:signal transduction histidine kinase